MTIEENKALVRRFVTEIFEQGRPEAIDQLCTDDFVRHNGGDTDREALKAAQSRVGQALADVRFTIDDEIAEGDRVAVRLTASARQVGEFMGMQPSNRAYEIGEIHIFRVRDGKVAEHWHQFDSAGMLKQLGATPASA
jgi:predicted ester cyclase